MLGYFLTLCLVSKVSQSNLHPKQSIHQLSFCTLLLVDPTVTRRCALVYVLCEVLRAARRYTTTDSVYTIAPATVFAVVYYRVKQ